MLSVGDGDTLTVSDGLRRVTIRLACIDAPETAQSPYGLEARKTLQLLAPIGSSVSIRGSKTDRYRRTLGEVFRGNSNINLELVRRGDAFAYRQYLSGCDRNAYLDAERYAELNRTGVWSVPGGITRPWDWRRGGRNRSGSAFPSAPTNSKRVRCRDLKSWEEAQRLLKQGHSYLDGDGDGNACESLQH